MFRSVVTKIIEAGKVVSATVMRAGKPEQLKQPLRRAATEANEVASNTTSRLSATTLAVPTWGVITTGLGIGLGAAKLGSDIHQGDKELTNKINEGDKELANKINEGDQNLSNEIHQA